MASATTTADWFQEERRKQNLAIAGIVLACLVFAFFPRNERRLFDFPGLEAFSASIDAPTQTRLRAAIFEPAAAQSPAAQGAGQEEGTLIPPAPEPVTDIDIFGDLEPPTWSIVGEPIRFEQPEGFALADLTQRDWMNGTPPRNLLRGGGLLFAGGVPEPETWALMILGIGAIAHRMRAERDRRLRARGRARWRRNLVP